MQHPDCGRIDRHGKHHRQGAGCNRRTETTRLPTRSARRSRPSSSSNANRTARGRRAARTRCETVDLYEGGQYWLYKYHRYSDVRLVFAPERSIAAFGGDPDNFQFPRWCLDMSVLRAYGPDGKPAVTPNFLSINPAGPSVGQLAFVSGHPGNTSRLLTVAQLQTLRNVFIPNWLLRSSELRGRLIEFGKTSPEAARIIEDPLNTLENQIKVRRKQLDALLDDRLLDTKRKEEAALRAKVGVDPQLAQTIGDPWAAITKAQSREVDPLPALHIHRARRPGSAPGLPAHLFSFARTLVRAGEERGKPNTERLRGIQRRCAAAR